MGEPLTDRLSSTAFAFRGYNVTNLGRTAELLGVDAYRDTITQRLREAERCCSEIVGREVDLIDRVRRGEEPDLDCYDEAIALVYGVELAQIDLLREHHAVEFSQAHTAFGYSLGELIAAACGGVFPPEDVLRIPLTMAADCASLAGDVTMGILFSRGPAVDEIAVRRACESISCEGEGTIGVSAVLSPNTMLVLGQGDTLARLKTLLRESFPSPVHLRPNDARWPPLHTPIIRQMNVTDRSAVMIEKIPILTEGPAPPVLSLVTGKYEYDDENARETLRRWIDQPQRLWDVVRAVLSSDVRTIVHVGPEPNVIPATFQRLAENVRQQTGERSLSGLGMRAVQQMANRPWLSALLPHQGNLLRAPSIRHVVLEDWLIENAP